MTEYLVFDLDGNLMFTPDNRFKMENDDDGPILLRGIDKLCCPCPGPSPFSCDCGHIVLLHPAVYGLWDIYDEPIPAPGPGCDPSTFNRTEELLTISAAPIPMFLGPCGLPAFTDFSVPWQKVRQISPIGVPFYQAVEDHFGTAAATCCAPGRVLISLAVADLGGNCEGRFVSSLERGRGQFTVQITIDVSTGLATEVVLVDALHSTSTPLDVGDWGAYCG